MPFAPDPDAMPFGVQDGSNTFGSDGGEVHVVFSKDKHIVWSESRHPILRLLDPGHDRQKGHDWHVYYDIPWKI